MEISASDEFATFRLQGSFFCPEDRDKSFSETMVSTKLHGVAARKSVITITL